MKGIRILLALALVSAASVATAEIYTWKDANGRVHFSDTPPPDTSVKSVKTATPTPEADASKPAAKTWQEKEQESRQRKAEQAQADEKKKDEQARAAEKERYCANLRKNITMLERGGRVGSPNDKGEFEFYSDEQMAKEAERARAQLARDCK